MGEFSTNSVTLLCPLYREFGQSHGSLNVITALQDGCEVFFAQLGGSMDARLLNYYGEDMGLGQLTGVELPESAGILAGPSHRELAGLAPWTPSMTPAAAVGLSDNTCTPIQLSTMLSTLLCGGDRYQTHLFYEAHSYVSGDVLERFNPALQAHMELTNDVRDVLLRALEDKAAACALLWDKTASSRANGIRIGYLGASSISTTVNSDNALCIAYGQRRDGEAISVCVVLEHGADPELATPTAAEIINAWAGK
jgi:penicillin-binding protein 2